MVATLLRLRFRILGNALSRHPWQLVGFIIGALYAAGVLFGATTGLVALGFAGPAIAAPIIVGVGSLVVLGWVLAPLLVFGMDTTLEPSRLAIFPISTNRLIFALTMAGIVGIPGIVTSVAALATFVTWAHWPGALAAAVPCVPLAVLICVVASRAVAALASGLGSGRRYRELTGVLVFIPIVLIGPIVAGVIRGVATSGGNLLETLSTTSAVLGWTPIGAAWAAPAAAAQGDWVGAAARFLIALATLAVLLLLWRYALVASAGSSQQRSSTAVKPGKIGAFGRFPATATGASAARSLTYWMRDPRYQRQLIIVPLMPIILYFYSSFGHADGGFRGIDLSAPIVSLILGITLYTDVSYDGTAFGLVVARGVRGRADRLGRVLAAGIIALPLLLLVAVVTIGISGHWPLLPPILGISVGVLLTCYGVSSVSSARLVIPVAAPGDNPFKRVPGTTFLMGISFLGIWASAIVLSIPEIVLGIIAMVTQDALLGWITVAVGVVLGAVVLALGVVLGGRTLDRTAPELLTRLKALAGS